MWLGVPVCERLGCGTQQSTVLDITYLLPATCRLSGKQRDTWVTNVQSVSEVRYGSRLYRERPKIAKC